MATISNNYGNVAIANTGVIRRPVQAPVTDVTTELPSESFATGGERAPEAAPAVINESHLEQLRLASTAKLESFEGGYTDSHMRRSARYANDLANALDGTPQALTAQEKAALSQAGGAYDVGKLNVPEEFWNKPGKPTPEEWAAMQSHVDTDNPQVSLLLQAHGVTSQAALSVVRHHHERFDGNGYPDKLKGDQIPKGSALLGIADMFDSLTCDRSFRAGKSYDEAASMLRENAQRGQFDPALVNVFLSKVVSNQDTLNLHKVATQPDVPAGDWLVAR